MVRPLSPLRSAEGCGWKTWPGLKTFLLSHSAASPSRRLPPSSSDFPSAKLPAFSPLGPGYVKASLLQWWPAGELCTFGRGTSFFDIEDCLSPGSAPPCVLQRDFEIPCVRLLSSHSLVKTLESISDGGTRHYPNWSRKSRSAELICTLLNSVVFSSLYGLAGKMSIKKSSEK